MPFDNGAGQGFPTKPLSSWSSEFAIYGLILVSALIIVTNTDHATSGGVLAKVAGTILVFWLAHAFAQVLARLSQAPASGPRAFGSGSASQE